MQQFLSMAKNLTNTLPLNCAQNWAKSEARPAVPGFRVRFTPSFTPHARCGDRNTVAGVMNQIKTPSYERRKQPMTGAVRARLGVSPDGNKTESHAGQESKRTE